MGWFKQLCLSWTILFAAAACVSCQGLRSTLREGNRACQGEEVTFTCTVRGSSSLAVLNVGWSSTEYIGQGGSLQLSTANMIGHIETITDMDGNITATATLTNNTDVAGELMLESTLRITATVASTVTCSGTSGGTESIEFSISAIPDAPQNVRAAQVSQDNDYCIILVQWDTPANVDESDIDHYIITVLSRIIVEDESSAITALRIRNCHRNDSIQVAAVTRFGCTGENSLETQPSLLDSIARSTTSTPTGSTPASAPVIAAASVAVVLFIILCVVVVLGLVLFSVLYKRGKKIQAAGQVLPPDVLRLEERVETETKLDDLQNRIVQDTLIKRNLEVLYNAMKLKLRSRNVQVAARDLRATLMLGMESSEFIEKVKEAFITCFEALQSENDEILQRVTENLDNILTGMTGIDEEFKESIRELHTKVGTDEYKAVLDDFIKRVEAIQPSTIMSFLLSLCEKLQNVRQVKDYYCKQSKHNVSDLGTEKDRVSVLIWMDELDDSWKDSLREAVKAINEAAPGLSLSIIKDKKKAIIHVLAVDKKEPYTEVEGNILMRLKEKKFVTKIHLGNWKDDWRKGACIHELLHALGFHHEHQGTIADSYVYHLDSGKQITINKNELRFIQFDLSSTTLYPCKKPCKDTSEGQVCKWVLDEYPTEVNTEFDELDRIGLNLVYPPCVDSETVTANNVRYRPKLGKNGIYYCGRFKVVLSQKHPKEGYTCPCGPNDGPNCSACRSIKSPRVKEILEGGRWQGLSGLVYCGRPFTETGKIFPTHDGICGMDNGPSCPDCENKLKAPEHVQSASDPLASVK